MSLKKNTIEAVALFEPVGSRSLLKQTAQEMGYHVIGVYTRKKEAYRKIDISEETFSEFCDTVIRECDFEKVLKKLKEFPHKVIACIASSEAGVEFAEKASSQLKFTTTPNHLMEARRNKGLMREVLMQSGLSCPEFSLCKTADDVKLFAKNHSFPLVIKTPRGASSDLVFICNTLERLLKHFEEILKSKNIFGYHTQEAVVEEYIRGKEYIVNTFSVNNKIYVTDVWVYEKIAVTDGLHIYYQTLSIPLDEPSIQSLVDYAKKATACFGIDNGRAHLEIKNDPQKGPTLIEIGARLSGASVPYLLRKYTSFDPFKATIEVFTTRKTEIDNPVKHHKHLAIVHCPISTGGKVESVQGISEIKTLPSYDSHNLSCKKGDIIPDSSFLGDIPCVVFLAHETRKQLLKDVESVHKLFFIEFEGGRKSIIPIGKHV